MYYVPSMRLRSHVVVVLVALASVGAVACLFAGLMLGVRLLRLLDILPPDPGTSDSPDSPPAPKGGKRAAR